MEAEDVGKDALEAAAELVSEHRVDEGVDAAVGEADQMGREHREEKVGPAEEALLLDLADQVDQVERGPGQEEGQGHHDHHPRNLPIKQ